MLTYCARPGARYSLIVYYIIFSPRGKVNVPARYFEAEKSFSTKEILFSTILVGKHTLLIIEPSP